MIRVKQVQSCQHVCIMVHGFMGQSSHLASLREKPSLRPDCWCSLALKTLYSALLELKSIECAERHKATQCTCNKSAKKANEGYLYILLGRSTFFVLVRSGYQLSPDLIDD